MPIIGNKFITENTSKIKCKQNELCRLFLQVVLIKQKNTYLIEEV